MTNKLGTADAVAAIRELVEREQADLLFYSGPIESNSADAFRELVRGVRKSRRPNVYLVLSTFGGDPNAAFRMARMLRRSYKSVTVVAFGPCKSAGTLIAIGANRVIMGEFGEFGPLDVQTNKTDDLLARSSGLDIFKAIAVVQQHAFSAFENYFLDIIGHSQGAISAKTAADIASQLAIGIFSPIMAKIEPLGIGEMQRAISIANAYGEKLGLPNVKPNGLSSLVSSYPSHGFVIDLEEAVNIFNQARLPDPQEAVLEEMLVGRWRDMIRRPTQRNPVMADILQAYGITQEHQNADPIGSIPDQGDGAARDSGSKRHHSSSDTAANGDVGHRRKGGTGRGRRSRGNGGNSDSAKVD